MQTGERSSPSARHAAAGCGKPPSAGPERASRLR
jgi:hypothetical protein